MIRSCLYLFGVRVKSNHKSEVCLIVSTVPLHLNHYNFSPKVFLSNQLVIIFTKSQFLHLFMMGMPDAVKQCETRHFINGEFVPSSDGGTFEVKSPYNHETVAHGKYTARVHFQHHHPSNHGQSCR